MLCLRIVHDCTELTISSRMILLNPGPVTLSERVRQALLRPDLCHREPEFSELQAGIRRGILDVYGRSPDAWTSILLTGSGTAAVEAMVASLVPEDGRLLVIENGVYGERMSRMAEVHGIPFQVVHHGWGDALDVPRIVGALDADEHLRHVAVVHHETTTGRLNDLAAIGVECRARNIGLLVDAVSSFGAEEIDFEAWGVAGCAATANKCLHGVPGASFVVARKNQLPTLEDRPRTVYLDLGGYVREQDRGGTPFTQSVQSFYALAEALAEMRDEGGCKARHRRYRELALLVRSGLEALGIRPMLAAEDSSVVLAAYRLPEGITYEELHDSLKREGFVIYAGQGGLAHSIFRVSTMGAITVQDMQRFVAVVGQTVND